MSRKNRQTKVLPAREAWGGRGMAWPDTQRRAQQQEFAILLRIGATTCCEQVKEQRDELSE